MRSPPPPPHSTKKKGSRRLAKYAFVAATRYLSVAVVALTRRARTWQVLLAHTALLTARAEASLLQNITYRSFLHPTTVTPFGELPVVAPLAPRHLVTVRRAWMQFGRDLLALLPPDSSNLEPFVFMLAATIENSARDSSVLRWYLDRSERLPQAVRRTIIFL